MKGIARLTRNYSEQGDRLAITITNKYLLLQGVDDGYDYTFIDADYTELDGGVYDNPEISVEEVIEMLLKELCQIDGVSLNEALPAATCVDYEQLMEKAR